MTLSIRTKSSLETRSNQRRNEDWRASADFRKRRKNLKPVGFSLEHSSVASRWARENIFSLKILLNRRFLRFRPTTFSLFRWLCKVNGTIKRRRLVPAKKCKHSKRGIKRRRMSVCGFEVPLCAVSLIMDGFDFFFLLLMVVVAITYNLHNKSTTWKRTVFFMFLFRFRQSDWNKWKQKISVKKVKKHFFLWWSRSH